MRKWIPIFLLLISVQHQLSAQSYSDTLRLSIPEAEKIFLQKNFELLAAKFNIDANKALIQQARLWDNPILNTDQNIYDGKFFRHNDNYGQVFIQVQQLIRTAGKRSKLAQLATDNTNLSSAQFEEILRNLRYTLHADLLETEHLLKIDRLYANEIAEVSKLVNGMDAVYKLGDISLKDNMRLKALLFSLQNEQVNIQSQLFPVQTELNLLLQSGDSSFIKPEFTYKLPDIISASLPPLDSLVNDAMSLRPDEKIARTALTLQQHNLIYQKSLAKPDLSVGPEFDQRNSYAPNYVGLAISLPLNIFNRNQGNIKSAEFNIKSQEQLTSQAGSRVRSEVTSSFQKVKYLQSINNKDQLAFATDYETLFQNMVKSYVNRQISLLDFTDFLDAYKDTRIKLVEQHINLVKACNDLNYAVNETVTPIQ